MATAMVTAIYGTQRCWRTMSWLNEYLLSIIYNMHYTIIKDQFLFWCCYFGFLSFCSCFFVVLFCFGYFNSNANGFSRLFTLLCTLSQTLLAFKRITDNEMVQNGVDCRLSRYVYVLFGTNWTLIQYVFSKVQKWEQKIY